ncbi:endonuclease Q family protein [Effusibacillus pohliae]|uniref:endonuclease Q family protein n=1 Tax=Effusibacillus pohliae TaxID=232270 RepID=UPI00036DD97B|nr:endonuclease Q family protein [Effusibacillus pohliae]
MNSYFLDLHIHIGRTLGNRPVKITASRDLRLFEIVKEAAERKGIDIVGIIDAVSPPVLQEFRELIAAGELVPLAGGGLTYQGKTTVLLGAEVETAGPHGGAAHFGVWMPDVETMQEFSDWLAARVTNPVLSSQRARCTSRELQDIAAELCGMFIINHAFTPHKSVYGSCVDKASEMLDLSKVTALELGLSADTGLADLFSEHANLTYLSNSDAHSLAKIGREYNRIAAAGTSFADVKKALLRQDGHRVLANYGLAPQLGKYHRTYCLDCNEVVPADPPVFTCPMCGGQHVLRGVLDRIYAIADRPQPVHPDHRPIYYYQVPLEFIPGVGKKTMERLLEAFGTEMNVLHQASEAELTEVVGERIARDIVSARNGTLKLAAGGGGKYGRAISLE